MRLFEFDDTINASIMGLLAHLKRKATGHDNATVNTKTFLKMLNNMGVHVDANGLEQLRGKNPAIGNLISGIEDDKITLNLSGETQDDGFDDLDFDDAMADTEMDSEMDPQMGMDPMGQPSGPTTDDFQDPNQMDQMGPMGQSVNAVPAMAKRAVARRQ